jgi:hypothetical protein
MMLRQFPRFFACLLLVLIPLQGFAAVSMGVCNSMMQLATESKTSVMPCHKNMVSMAKTQDSCKHKTACKTNCAALCASLSGMTALTQTPQAMPVLAATQVFAARNQTYTSYLPPNLQRPPIFLS